jgi:hypothetical protein
MISVSRTMALAAIGIVGLASILATGGGGGGDDGFDGGDDGDVNILPTYGYSISALPDESPLMVALDTTEGIYLISVDFSDTLSGTVDTGFVGEDDVVLPGRIIEAGSHIAIDSDAGQTLLGAFTVTVIEDVEFTFDNPPSSGAVAVEFETESIRAQIVSGGVELSLNGGTATFFGWDAFDDVLGDSMAPDWQRRGALGLSGLDFVYEQALGVVDALNLIDDFLASSNPLEQMCDSFMGTPPVGVLTQGMFTLTWLGSGSVQPGDDFRWQFTDCWVDDPFDDVDQVLNGGIDLLGYTSVESGGNLTRTGFEPYLMSDGGVVFDNFETVEVVEDGLGNFAIEPGTRVTLNGGFVVVFFAP